MIVITWTQSCFALIPPTKNLQESKPPWKAGSSNLCLIPENKTKSKRKGKCFRLVEWECREEYDCCLQIRDGLHYEKGDKIVFCVVL